IRALLWPRSVMNASPIRARGTSRTRVTTRTDDQDLTVSAQEAHTSSRRIRDGLQDTFGGRGRQPASGRCAAHAGSRPGSALERRRRERRGDGSGYRRWPPGCGTAVIRESVVPEPPSWLRRPSILPALPSAVL